MCQHFSLYKAWFYTNVAKNCFFGVRGESVSLFGFPPSQKYIHYCNVLMLTGLGDRLFDVNSPIWVWFAFLELFIELKFSMYLKLLSNPEYLNHFYKALWCIEYE